MQITKYRVASGETRNLLEIEVAAYLTRGYQPYGNLVTTGFTEVGEADRMVFSQAMVKHYHADALTKAAPSLLAACKEFIRKCDSGEARSKRSYAQMKEAVGMAEQPNVLMNRLKNLTDSAIPNCPFVKCDSDPKCEPVCRHANAIPEIKPQLSEEQQRRVDHDIAATKQMHSGKLPSYQHTPEPPPLTINEEVARQPIPGTTGVNQMMHKAGLQIADSIATTKAGWQPEPQSFTGGAHNCPGYIGQGHA